MFSCGQSLDQSFRCTIDEREKTQSGVDPRTARKRGSAIDVQPKCIVDLKLGVDDALFRVFPHSSSAKIVAASHPGKAVTPPGAGCAHAPQYFFRLRFHPIGQPVFVLSQVIRDSKDRETNPAPVSIVRVDVHEVVIVGQGVWLDANNAEMLPLPEVILVGFPPALDAGRECFTTDLDW